MKKCTSCGGSDLTKALIDYTYARGSKQETVLLNIESWTCACGEYFVSIPSDRVRHLDAAYEADNPEPV